jgi:hypothetical protein
MTYSRTRWFAAVTATALVIGFGLFGALIAYSFEEEQQMHGVEPGPEATWALWWEALGGFMVGTIGSAICLGALTLGVCLMWRRWRS